MAPSLLGVAQRHSREELATIIRQGTGRMPAFTEMLEGGAINDLVNFLVTGKRRRGDGDDEPELPQVPKQRLSDLPRSRRLPGHLAAVGDAERDRPEHGRDPMEDPVRRIPGACGAGDQEYGDGQLRRSGRDEEWSPLHRRDDVRQEVPRVRQADGRAAVGGGASRVRQRDAVAVRRERQGVRRDRRGGRKERSAVRRDVRGVQSAVGGKAGSGKRKGSGKREAESGRRETETDGGRETGKAPLTRLPLPVSRLPAVQIFLLSYAQCNNACRCRLLHVRSRGRQPRLTCATWRSICRQRRICRPSSRHRRPM